MAQSLALRALQKKRGQLAGEIQKAERALAKMRRDLNTIDATLNIFEPQTNPDLIPAIRPRVRLLFFDYGEMTVLCYEAFRRAKGPLSTNQILDHALAAKGLEVDWRVRKKLYANVWRALSRMVQRGQVRRVVVEPEVWWELAL
jgi:hypothetical protein